MPIKKKTNKKLVAVNRKFLSKLADTIYNPKDRSFLRLCDGTLQNGPDPEDDSRPMHCGLGELYYAMTGTHPEMDGVDEEGVVEMAVKLSPFQTQKDAAFAAAQNDLEKAMVAVKKFAIDDLVKDDLLQRIEDAKSEVEDSVEMTKSEAKFRDILDGIPDTNDEACGDESCDDKVFRDRSRRVAQQLRKAAACLPR
jgi:hypothetical protein